MKRHAAFLTACCSRVESAGLAAVIPVDRDVIVVSIRLAGQGDRMPVGTAERFICDAFRRQALASSLGEGFVRSPDCQSVHLTTPASVNCLSASGE